MFLMWVGVTKALFKNKGPQGDEKDAEPAEVTGIKASLPTTIFEGDEAQGGWMVTLLGVAAICEPAPESAYHSDGVGGGVRVIVLN